MDIISVHGERFSNTSGDARGGSVTVTRAAATDRTYWITDLDASAAQATAVINVVSAGTTFWRQRVNGSTTVAYMKNFVTPLRITTGSPFTVRLDIGDAIGTNGSAFVNVAGYFIGS